MNYIIKRILTSVFLILLIYLCLKNSYVLMSTLILISHVAIYEFSQIYNNIFAKKNFLRFISTLFSFFYLILFALVIWFNLNTNEYNQSVSLIFIILICISTDIGGFIFGKIIGGKKLTKISPNKTYSGMAGSFLFSLSFGYLFYYTQKDILIYGFNIFIIIIIVSLTSQIGDLIVSFLKRKAKIKDTGSILPGHGGILDRIDGMLAAIPLGIFLVSI